MREIKFRVWNGEMMSSPFCPWELLSDSTGGLMTKDGTSVWWNADGFRGENWLQYTGLKDNNGKEIFEGDIVKVKWYLQADYKSQEESTNGEVQFGNGGFIVNTDFATPVDGASVDFIVNDCDTEVIGNIHENPELIEVKNE